MTEDLHCMVCGQPAATFDAQRDGWVCEEHALRVSPREREAVEAMEQRDRRERTHFLIGKRPD